MLAAIQAPVILTSQNRQAEKDRLSVAPAATCDLPTLKALVSHRQMR